jgi:hypothetical protein
MLREQQYRVALSYSMNKSANRRSQLPLTTSKGRGFIGWNKFFKFYLLLLLLLCCRPSYGKTLYHYTVHNETQFPFTVGMSTKKSGWDGTKWPFGTGNSYFFSHEVPSMSHKHFDFGDKDIKAYHFGICYGSGDDHHDVDKRYVPISDTLCLDFVLTKYARRGTPFYFRRPPLNDKTVSTKYYWQLKQHTYKPFLEHLRCYTDLYIYYCNPTPSDASSLDPNADEDFYVNDRNTSNYL